MSEPTFSGASVSIADIRRYAEQAIYAIENLAAIRAYRAGMGASEWEAFVKPEQREALDYYRRLSDAR